MKDNPIIDVEIRTRITERAPMPYWQMILWALAAFLVLDFSFWLWVNFIRWACR